MSQQALSRQGLGPGGPAAAKLVESSNGDDEAGGGGGGAVGSWQSVSPRYNVCVVQPGLPRVMP